MISIIIPSYNAGTRFRETLRAIKEQTVSDIEVLVIDSGSTDETMLVAEEFGCRVMSTANFDHGGTRNQAAFSAAGTVLAFLTQDVLPANADWLQELIAPIQAGTADATYSRQMAEPHGSTLERESRAYNYPPRDLQTTLADVEAHGFKRLYFSNASSAIRTSTFKDLGGFSAPSLFGEDVDFAYRALVAGHSIFYASKSLVWHTHSFSLSQSFRRYFDVGVAHQLHPEWFSMRGTVKSAGKGLAIATLRSALSRGEVFEAASASAHMAVRLLGYQLGQLHRRIPKKLVLSLTSNRRYWLRQE